MQRGQRLKLYALNECRATNKHSDQVELPDETLDNTGSDRKQRHAPFQFEKFCFELKRREVAANDLSHAS